ncbi:GHKL domain-containing protein [Bifidobacterium lemurum]|uniref:GHKL domain-containing protein n=1 Tax=Bifidobacterium lemurum TaxID=1603886 RepID=A0A261FUK2_9BIFI|nr:GHKL domain-containing protein [Bifidobacterium lemurum]OZG62872.1 GHKL domain-containing protein [Bifidobacterium lemurum]QOL35197.1 sensor histidine kinase [Bifidobacterium lemurum]
MNSVGVIPDIPKIYTALAEWLSCMVIIGLCVRKPPRPRDVAVAVASLAALVLVQIGIGVVPLALWLPGMALALGVMLLTIWVCCRFTAVTAVYWLMRAFLLAEFAASIEWQLYFHMVSRYGWSQAVWVQALMLLVVYGAVFGAVVLLERRPDLAAPDVTGHELLTAVIIAGTTFALSNLSYVSTATPFTSTIGTEVFNIRTLVGFGGVAFMYAFHIQLCENHARKELDSIRNLLDMQYAQYQQSKESVAVINHKYHDLKHQIAVLRRESDPDRRERYLDDIEQGIKTYEAQYKTGNAVLDTMLTAKGLVCAKDGIELTCVADGALLARVSEMDVCTIFGNALDNAIEYERRIADPAKRLIHVSVSEANGFALVRVENYLMDADAGVGRGAGGVAGATRALPSSANDDLPATTKRDKRYHGFGLKSVRHTVAQYGGTLTVGPKDHWFELTVLLPLR